VDFAELGRRAAEFGDHLERVKATVPAPAVGWYPRMLPGRIETLDALLVGEHRALLESPSGRRIADIGAADGDLGFFLESVGFEVDLYDGADRPLLLKEALDSQADVHFVDLDHDFELPRKYELVFLLHVLYHLRNPFLALETLAEFSQYCILSTRVANRLGTDRFWKRRPDLKDVPVAYLLDPFELSPGDAGSFWIFSEAGLTRLASRCGWDVVASLVVGDVSREPDDLEQPRMWCLLRSREFTWTEPSGPGKP
jgi:hypothetical protein